MSLNVPIFFSLRNIKMGSGFNFLGNVKKLQQGIFALDFNKNLINNSLYNKIPNRGRNKTDGKRDC